MSIQKLSTGQFPPGTVRTVDLLRRDRACPVTRDQHLPLITAKGFQLAAGFQGLQPLGKDPIQQLRLLRIQQIADLIVTGNALNPKQTAHVAFAFALFHQPLIGQKGPRLGEEDAKGAQRSIFDFILRVLAAAMLRQFLKAAMELFY